MSNPAGRAFAVASAVLAVAALVGLVAVVSFPFEKSLLDLPAGVSAVLCVAGIAVMAFAPAVAVAAGGRLAVLVVILGASVALYPTVIGGANAQASGVPGTFLALVLFPVWHTLPLVLMQVVPLYVSEVVSGRRLRGFRTALTTLGIAGVVVVLLAGPPPELGVGWFVSADSPLGGFFQALLPAITVLWFASFVVAPAVTWWAARRTTGEARRDAILAAIAAIVPVWTITLCTALGVAGRIGGLPESSAISALMVGLSVSSVLCVFLLAGALRAGALSRPLAARVIVAVLTAVVLATGGLVAIVVGMLVGAALHDQPWLVALVTTATVGAVGVGAVRISRWVGSALDPNRAFAKELGRVGSLAAGDRAQPIQVALRLVLDDPDAQLFFRLADGDGWVDVASRPADRPAGCLQITDTVVLAVGSPRSGTRAQALRDLPRLVEPVALHLAAAHERELAQQDAALARDAIAEERSRLLRDMHDGLQGRLLGIALGLQSASKSRGDAAATLFVDEAVTSLRAAIDELRALAAGDIPATLAASGLGPAVHEFVSAIAVPVQVVATPRRMRPEIEAVGYFVVAESITNAVKHAGAGTIDVAITVEDDVLTITVEDDGRGSADSRAGSGLRGLAERVSAVGGVLVISERAPRGTLVEASMPCA